MLSSTFSNAAKARNGELGGDLGWTFDAVQERLVEAWAFLTRLPDREAGWLRVQATWPDVRRHHAFGDYGDMDVDARPRLPGLSSGEVGRMEEALSWLQHVPERDRKLVGLALAQLQRIARPEWVWIARRLGSVAEPDAYRMRYGRAITRICRALNTAENRG